MTAHPNSTEDSPSYTGDYDSGHRIPRWVFMRLLGIVYFLAIASFWSQAMGLIGESGIIPAQTTQAQFEAGLENGRYDSWMDWPTLFYFLEGTDNTIHSLCFFGVLLSIALFVGVISRVVLIGLWVIYLSLVTLSSPFLPFQWDLLLLEISIVALFYAPGTVLPGVDRAREPNLISIWLVRIVLFKLMISSGVVKLISPEPNQWQDLTALNYHFWTQPIPHGMALHVDHLGEQMRELGVLFNHVVELVIPWLILFPIHRYVLLPWLALSIGFLWTDMGELNLATALIFGGTAFLGWFIPRWLQRRDRMTPDHGRVARITAGCFIIALMVAIGGTGNYGFFNVLTIAMTMCCFDDRFIMAWVPKGIRENMSPPSESRPPSRVWLCVSIMAALILIPWNTNRLLLTVGGQQYVDAKKEEKKQADEGLEATEIQLSAGQRFWLWVKENDRSMNERFGSFHMVRNYGLFATMTTERYELRIEGSHDGRIWKPFRFRYKPDTEADLHFAWTHMPRLDWQLWFVSLWPSCQGRAFYQRNWWFFNFLEGLLDGSPEISDLLEENPFERTPPRFIRVLRDRARFSTPEEYAETGNPWVFERVKTPFCPILDKATLRRSGIRRIR